MTINMWWCGHPVRQSVSLRACFAFAQFRCKFAYPTPASPARSRFSYVRSAFRKIASNDIIHSFCCPESREQLFISASGRLFKRLFLRGRMPRAHRERMNSDVFRRTRM
jgi:hypothetical protein